MCSATICVRSKLAARLRRLSLCAKSPVSSRMIPSLASLTSNSQSACHCCANSRAPSMSRRTKARSGSASWSYLAWNVQMSMSILPENWFTQKAPAPPASGGCRTDGARGKSLMLKDGAHSNPRPGLSHKGRAEGTPHTVQFPSRISRSRMPTEQSPSKSAGQSKSGSAFQPSSVNMSRSHGPSPMARPPPTER